jgi:thiol-disulfide isomerase/thioredoxin
MRLSVILIFFCVCQYASWAQIDKSQSGYPEVGRRCPNFALKNIQYYSKNEATQLELSGKWLVLVFWDKYCGACVASFPEINAMQGRFNGKVQFMLVGIQDHENKIEAMYAKYKEKENLKMPCAFDSLLSNRWGIYTCPHIIVVDDKGVVRGVTNTLDSGDIEEFLRGGTPVLASTYSGDPEKPDYKIPFDDRAPFMVDGNGAANDTDFLFRSILALWNPITQKQIVPVDIDLNSIDSTRRKGKFQVMGLPLLYLYQYAYFGRNLTIYDTTMYGKYYDKPVLEITDSSAFQYSYRGNGRNVYSYSLILPQAVGTKARLEEIMQRDLKSYFKFDAMVEIRECPCWRLVAMEGAKVRLQTKGGAELYKEIIPRARFTLQNVPIRRLILAVSGPSQGIVIDETGIVGNIDITLNCVDLDDIKKSLQENGLELVRGEKEMKVLVIRDAK